MCVPIAAEDPQRALADADQARLAGADLIEWRLDGLYHGHGHAEGLRAAAMLVERAPLPCIATCRVGAEGGLYDGDDAARAELFERLASCDRPPRYIDAELASLTADEPFRRRVEAVAGRLAPAPGAPGLIVSTHDFEGRPADLTRRVAQMRELDAACVHKIAFRARSVRDNLELFDLLAERNRPMIALGMGEFGMMSRLLAGKFGALLTFASLRDESGTAPGQPTITELLGTYRFRSIGGRTRVYGVIGHPVGHSLSPVVHNAGFEAVGHDGVYLPLPVAPGWEPFKASVLALTGHEGLGFSGASVTIPHKEHASRLATEERWRLGADARDLGAANTLLDERVINTDTSAIAACVREHCDGATRAAVLGAGGAARAAAWTLNELGWDVTIWNRTPDRARSLAEELGVAWADTPRAAIGDALLAVNTTPVGMTGGPAPDDSLLTAEDLAGLDDRAVVFDTVYAPLETPLLRLAKDRGLRTIEGAEMFIQQASVQFQEWTGHKTPLELFERVVRERLGSTPASPAP